MTVAKHFALDPNEQGVARMTEQLGLYSKDPARQRRHNPADSEEKRAAASPAIRESAVMAEASYRELLERAFRLDSHD
ncbi:MAG: hypothetical protein U5O39_14765 [Gammaproteobacteria bacterium]|nr:hypothetical protein [Gammaproteobacteria bacterium]